MSDKKKESIHNVSAKSKLQHPPGHTLGISCLCRPGGGGEGNLITGVFRGMGNLIKFNVITHKNKHTMGHLNGFLARGGWNLNNNFQKSQMSEELPGMGGRGVVEASI